MDSEINRVAFTSLFLKRSKTGTLTKTNYKC